MFYISSFQILTPTRRNKEGLHNIGVNYKQNKRRDVKNIAIRNFSFCISWFAISVPFVNETNSITLIRPRFRLNFLHLSIHHQQCRHKWRSQVYNTLKLTYLPWSLRKNCRVPSFTEYYYILARNDPRANIVILSDAFRRRFVRIRIRVSDSERLVLRRLLRMRYLYQRVRNESEE